MFGGSLPIETSVLKSGKSRSRGRTKKIKRKSNFSKSLKRTFQQKKNSKYSKLRANLMGFHGLNHFSGPNLTKKNSLNSFSKN
jgi:hypothetical protein